MEAQRDAHQEPPESDDSGKQYFRRIHLICDDTETDDGMGGGGWFGLPADEPVPLKPAWRTVPKRTHRNRKNKPEGLHIATSPDPRAQVPSWATWQRKLVYFHIIYHYTHFFWFFQRIPTWSLRLRPQNPLCSYQIVAARDFSVQECLVTIIPLQTQGLKYHPGLLGNVDWFIFTLFTIALIFFFGSFSGSQHGPYTSIRRTHFARTRSWQPGTFRSKNAS